MSFFPFRKKADNEVKSSGALSFIIQFGVIAVLFFAIGFSVGQKKIQINRQNFIPKITVQNQVSPSDQNVDFSLFWQVWDSIPKTFLDKSAIDSQKLMYGAISGMVRSLGDPYTVFLDPKQNESIKGELSGSYSGVGIEIGFNKDKRLVVIAPISGTPAEKAGIQPKDLILKIAGKDTSEMTLAEAVDMIRGAAGTQVKLTLAHDGSDTPYDVTVNREQITVKSINFQTKDAKVGKVAIIKVSRFGETTNNEWDEAVNQVQLQGAKAVVVDLRNNPGGLLDSAVHLASDFVTGVVVKQQFADGSVKPLNADHNGALLKIPMVVLVNGGSASASEIFAGAMQDKRRGKIIGEQSFGKGTVQDALDLPGGSGLHITIAKWLTPNGKNIHGFGITPDLVVKLTTDDRDNNRDPQMDSALSSF